MVGINRQGEGKNSIGNGDAKELIHMTHGYDLSGVMLVGDSEQRGIKRRKKWDSCNNIINKMYLKYFCIHLTLI